MAVFGLGSGTGPIEVNLSDEARKQFEDYYGLTAQKEAEEKQRQENYTEGFNPDYKNSPSYKGGDTRNNVADEQAQIQQARGEQALAAQKQATEQARASASAGINKPRAGMLSENSNQQNTTNNLSQLYSMGKNQTNTTSSDYLQKMAQADALDQQASNIRSGSALTAAGGAIQGGVTGATMGASLGMGSDENMKESPIDDKQLKDAIKQFKELYRRVRCQHR